MAESSPYHLACLNEINGLVDSGEWREVGITHWHLVRWEASIKAMADARSDLVAGHIARGTPCYGPHEAMRWIFDEALSALRGPTRWDTWPDLLFSTNNAWALLTKYVHLLTPVGHMVALGTDDRRVAAIHAYPMTKSRCRGH